MLAGVHKAFYNLRLYNREGVTIESIRPDDPRIVEATVLQGVSNDRIGIDIQCNKVKLKGLTITNPTGTGIRVLAGVTSDKCSLENCIIRRCGSDKTTPTDYGGGIYNFGGTISNCIIKENKAIYGGGLYNCTGPITNCIIIQNTATGKGGGLYGCTGTITHCTIAKNEAKNSDGTATVGGIFAPGSAPTIKNCILWGNRDDTANILQAQANFASGITHSCIEDGTPGSPPFDASNIDLDPAFVNVYTTSIQTKYDGNDGFLSPGPYDPSNQKYRFDRLQVVKTTPNPFIAGTTVIEYDNDGVPRTVYKTETRTVKGADYYVVYFSPPRSPATESGKTVYIWRAGTTSVIEDYHLTAGSPCRNAGADGSCGIHGY